jgi:hypothetical protein
MKDEATVAAERLYERLRKVQAAEMDEAVETSPAEQRQHMIDEIARFLREEFGDGKRD